MVQRDQKPLTGVVSFRGLRQVLLVTIVLVSTACSRESTRLLSVDKDPAGVGPTMGKKDSDGAEAKSKIADLLLRDWKPRSMLKGKVTRVDHARFPAIDAHNHLKKITDVHSLLETMKAANVETIVNLDGLWGAELSKQLERFDKAYPGRFLTFAQIDFAGFDDANWTERTVKQMERYFRAGAKGLKVHKTLGLTHRHEKTGKLIRIDDSRLDPIWTLCGRYRRPVVIHTADPAAFFRSLDRFNERWHELTRHPDWHFYGHDFPDRDGLLAQRNRVIERHPETIFIGAHFANNPEDLQKVSKWLDHYPNFYLDISARINELGRQPYSARRFFLKYRDRILFGTDTTPENPEAYRAYFRFLESDDEYWDSTSSHHRQGFWMVYGLFLPEPVLSAIYRSNAQRVLFSTSAPQRSGSRFRTIHDAKSEHQYTKRSNATSGVPSR